VKPVLGRLTVRASRNSIFIQQCRLVLPSPLVLSFLIALASLRAVSSCGLFVRWHVFVRCHVFLRWHLSLRCLFLCRQIIPSAQFISPSVLSCCPPEKGSGGAGVVVGVRGAGKAHPGQVNICPSRSRPRRRALQSLLSSRPLAVVSHDNPPATIFEWFKVSFLSLF